MPGDVSLALLGLGLALLIGTGAAKLGRDTRGLPQAAVALAGSLGVDELLAA